MMSTTPDAAYEFDAPQFYDFQRASIGCSEASGWFDQQADKIGEHPQTGEWTADSAPVIQTVETDFQINPRSTVAF